MMKTKSELRKEISKISKEISKISKEISKISKEILSEISYREFNSLEISRLIFSLPEYKNADTILAYIALPDEVDLILIIADALAEGKKIFLPCVDDSNGKMTFHRITPETKLEKGAFGILEPPSNSESEFFLDTKSISSEEPSDKLISPKTIALIPGRAFTKDGKRLGRGGGYYDRFLQNFGNDIAKVGVCFPFQILDDIPTEETDCKVDKVVF